MLRRSHPDFLPALEVAQRIDGFTSATELCLLYHLARGAAPVGSVVEIGSYLGRSTVVLASAAIGGEGEPVTAVDPHQNVLTVARERPRDTRAQFLSNVEAAGVGSHVHLRHMTSVEAAREWSGRPVSMLFVDGLHTREAVLEDVNSWKPFMTPDGCVVFDDFLPFPGVRAAVRELRDSGSLPGHHVIVGKMAAFGPRSILRSVPAPPGARALARVDDRMLDWAIRLLAPQPAPQ